VECIFLGYSEENKAHRLMRKYDKVIIISCDAIFEEMSNKVPVIDDIKDFILDPNFFKPHTNHYSMLINSILTEFCEEIMLFSLDLVVVL
jgi:hypothetical protein